MPPRGQAPAKSKQNLLCGVWWRGEGESEEWNSRKHMCKGPLGRGPRHGGFRGPQVRVAGGRAGPGRRPQDSLVNLSDLQ